jgi:hypothetical protein
MKEEIDSSKSFLDCCRKQNCRNWDSLPDGNCKLKSKEFGVCRRNNHKLFQKRKSLAEIFKPKMTVDFVKENSPVVFHCVEETKEHFLEKYKRMHSQN